MLEARRAFIESGEEEDLVIHSNRHLCVIVERAVFQPALAARKTGLLSCCKAKASRP
jgi:hypothetical protein